MSAHTTSVMVDGWPRPSGYSNGVIVQGPTLFIAGQIGWDERQVLREGFVAQFDQALANVAAVIAAAGADAADIAKMTIYVTDLDAYRENLSAIGAAWRSRLGKVFPAMALVGVAGLVERGALVEIETTVALRA
jgi:enamine deaminase RidA (YjgF/YER057c/UK114 family)